MTPAGKGPLPDCTIDDRWFEDFSSIILKDII